MEKDAPAWHCHHARSGWQQTMQEDLGMPGADLVAVGVASLLTQVTLPVDDGQGGTADISGGEYARLVKREI
eukprot:6213577-Pleurochrysis_carterae.AAC.2